MDQIIECGVVWGTCGTQPGISHMCSLPRGHEVQEEKPKHICGDCGAQK